MENLYFPLFLVALAIVVIWVFTKARSGQSRNRRSASRPSGRLADVERPPRNRQPLGAAARLQSGQGRSTPGDIWKTKRERAAKESFTEPSPGVAYRATYLEPGPGTAERVSSARELKDQKVSEAEHLGIDEYFSKAAREEARERAKKAAQEESELSMTAMKYDPAGSEATSDDVEKEPKRRAGFKP